MLAGTKSRESDSVLPVDWNSDRIPGCFLVMTSLLIILLLLMLLLPPPSLFNDDLYDAECFAEGEISNS